MNAVFLHFILDEASKIYEVFVSIERIPQLLRYYINCQKGYLFHRWKTLIDSDQDYLELVRVFYELMLDNWKIQVITNISQYSRAFSREIT